jgi:hypothetical protein
MLQHSLARYRVQDFWQGRLHALAHAGGEYDYIHGELKGEIVKPEV